MKMEIQCVQEGFYYFINSVLSLASTGSLLDTKFTCNSKTVNVNVPLNKSAIADKADFSENSYFKSILSESYPVAVVQLYGLLVISWYFFNLPLIRKLPGVKLSIEVMISNLTMLLLSPIIVVTYSITTMVRFVLSIYFKIVYGDRIKLMSPIDSFWAVNKKIDTNYFHYLQVIEGNLSSFDRINNRLLEDENSFMSNREWKLLNNKIRDCKVVTKFGYYCWERIKEFKYTNQIKYLIDDKEKRKTLMSKESLLEEIHKAYDEPIDPGIPQWQIFAVPHFDCEHSRKTGKNCYALIYKIHHAIMDGLSAQNSVVNYRLADKPVKLSVDPLEPLNFSKLQWVMIYVKMWVFGAHIFLKTMFIRDRNCFHPSKRNIGDKTFSWSRPISLEALKKIRRNTNTTFTSVIIAGVGGALRSLALKKGLPVPDIINSMITVAVLPYKDLEPTNGFSLAHLPIETGRKSVGSRLESAASSAAKLAKSVDVLINFNVMKFFGAFPAHVILSITESGDSTFVLTNSPGPTEEMTFFGGDRLVEFIAWNVIKVSMGLGVTVTTYNGKVRAAMVGDKASIADKKDIPDLIKQFENEIVALAHHANVPIDSVFL